MDADTLSENTATVWIMSPSLIYSFILDTPDYEPPLCHCSKFVTTGCLYFSEEEYNHNVYFQTEWIRTLKTWRSREFNIDELFL